MPVAAVLPAFLLLFVVGSVPVTITFAAAAASDAALPSFAIAVERCDSTFNLTTMTFKLH